MSIESPATSIASGAVIAELHRMARSDSAARHDALA